MMPDTGAYLALGLAVIFIVMGVYVGSLLMRFRRADQTEDMLETLRKP